MRSSLVISLLLLTLLGASYQQRSSSAQFRAHALSPKGEPQPELVVQLGNPGGVGLVSYSPDGQLVLTSEDTSSTGKDFSICLWHVETGKQLRRFSGQDRKS